MRIAVGSEHRGYRAKNDLLKYLRLSGHEVEDFGCHELATVDCSDIARPVAAAVARSECEIGVLVSASGTEMCILANKVRGIRAAVVQDEFVARRTREKHHCNILCLGADLDGSKHLKKIVEHFLSAKVESDHHALALKKLAQIEQMSESEELIRAKDVAEAANRAKDRFLAMLSHDLRTPLSPALMTATSLEQDQGLPERFRVDVGLIRRNIESEVFLIDSLLDLTRVANGKFSLHLEIVHAHSLLPESVVACRPDALARSLEIRLDFQAVRHVLRADPAKLQQVFCNLLKNAIKFSNPNSRITVRTLDEGVDSLKIEISDMGIGIAADVLPHIFDPFEQGGNAVTQRFGGLGLGLAICKGIVENGGVISASSEGAGKGATLSVVLPSATMPQIP